MSCHVCGMWIEMSWARSRPTAWTSCHVCGMWIEIGDEQGAAEYLQSHATYVACGLKWRDGAQSAAKRRSCHVCGMWIEISSRSVTLAALLRHATYVACGLKYRHDARLLRRAAGHATYVACGLKSTIYRQVYHIPPCHAVTVKSPTHKNTAGLPC